MLTKTQVLEALARLGELAEAEGEWVELVVVGGAALMLGGHPTRLATHDVDALILSPYPPERARRLIGQVAAEQALASDWLNDAAKGFLIGGRQAAILLEAPGIRVWAPETAQLLAMKLSAWRDIRDAEDARYLLNQLRTEVGPAAPAETLWALVEPYLVPGRQLRAQYAFQELVTNEGGEEDEAL